MLYDLVGMLGHLGRWRVVFGQDTSHLPRDCSRGHVAAKAVGRQQTSCQSPALSRSSEAKLNSEAELLLSWRWSYLPPPL